MKSVQEMVEVMEHFANCGDVECIHINAAATDWEDAPSPSWNWASYDYRIKQPAKKTVKMLCYFNRVDDTLEWIAERYPLVGAASIRQPHLDMEAEV